MMRHAFLIPLIFTLALLAVLTASLLTSSEAGFRGVGIVVIGPLPIIIDTSDPAAIPLLLIPFILAALAFFLMFLKTRRKVRLNIE